MRIIGLILLLCMLYTPVSAMGKKYYTIGPGESVEGVKLFAHRKTGLIPKGDPNHPTIAWKGHFEFTGEEQNEHQDIKIELQRLIEDTWVTVAHSSFPRIKPITWKVFDKEYDGRPLRMEGERISKCCPHNHSTTQKYNYRFKLTNTNEHEIYCVVNVQRAHTKD